MYGVPVYDVQSATEFKNVSGRTEKTANNKNIRPEFIPQVPMEARVIIFQKCLAHIDCKIYYGGWKMLWKLFQCAKILTIIRKINQKEIAVPYQ